MNNKEKLYLVKLAGAAAGAAAAGAAQPTAQDYGNAANMAAQPLVGMAGSMWNSFAPQGAKDWAQGKAMNMAYGGGFNNDVNKMGLDAFMDAASSDERTGFNWDKSQGEMVESQDAMSTSGNQQQTDQRASTTQAGTAQNPFNQVMGSLIKNDGNMPTRTFNTGSNIYKNVQTANGEMGKTSLLPGQNLQQAHSGVTNNFMAQNPIKPPAGGQQL